MNRLDNLYHEQLNCWELARKNTEALKQTENKHFEFEGFNVWVQHNPSRIQSTAANTTSREAAARPCPLCDKSRPAEQLSLPFSNGYSILLNPYPVLDRHFTITTDKHIKQEIQGRLPILTEFVSEYPGYSALYNGPECGASIPGHFHFQAVPEGTLPVEKDWKNITKVKIKEDREGTIYRMNDYLRSCYLLESKQTDWLSNCVDKDLWVAIDYPVKDEKEPMMNLLIQYHEKIFRVFLFPRRLHRPSYYYKERDEQLLVSPGIIDETGIIVLPRKQDFEQITKENIIDIYNQISF